jgi:murein hydrolase activator
VYRSFQSLELTPPRPVRVLALALMLTAPLTIDTAGAGEIAIDSAIGEQTAELSELSDALRVATVEQTDLTSEVETLREDRAELNRRLIETAERIQASERQITIAEDRLASLTGREADMQNSLKSRRYELTELLAALQRLGVSPPPAIAVRPENALAAIRSAILLGSLVPELRDKARKLSADLGELVALRHNIEEEKTRLAETASQLAIERERIATLLESKRDTLGQTEQDLAAISAQAEALAARTSSLRDLIAQMDQHVSTQIAPRPEDPSAPISNNPANARTAMSDPGRIRPAIAFTDVRGMLPLPVSGIMLQNFGDSDDFGGQFQGETLATRKLAQVTAPSDGWVVYAGPFRSYGQLLIINAGNGYHVLLAGMERINVVLGQFVLAGEPVAVMGQGSTLARTLVATESADQPILYVEFRRNGTSIDPAPWWVSDEQRVRG